jgi:short-subunit dehydrogenase
MKDVAIVTGASGGIGYEIALLFASNKIDIVLVAINKHKLEIAKDNTLKYYNINILCVNKDLSVSDGIDDINNCMEKIDFL